MRSMTHASADRHDAIGVFKNDSILALCYDSISHAGLHRVPCSRLASVECRGLSVEPGDARRGCARNEPLFGAGLLTPPLLPLYGLGLLTLPLLPPNQLIQTDVWIGLPSPRTMGVIMERFPRTLTRTSTMTESRACPPRTCLP